MFQVKCSNKYQIKAVIPWGFSRFRVFSRNFSLIYIFKCFSFFPLSLITSSSFPLYSSPSFSRLLFFPPIPNPISLSLLLLLPSSSVFFCYAVSIESVSSVFPSPVFTSSFFSYLLPAIFSFRFLSSVFESEAAKLQYATIFFGFLSYFLEFPDSLSSNHQFRPSVLSSVPLTLIPAACRRIKHCLPVFLDNGGPGSLPWAIQ